MKNIHLLPTDKPSNIYMTNKLYKYINGVKREPLNCTNLNIYITSDGEIKEGDWVYTPNKTIMLVTAKYATESSFMIGNSNHEKSPYYIEFCKKIILTTDQDLIKDGVQAIDDEFLEWFVKNPSCEEVAVGTWSNFAKQGNLYHIIIPKEEQKQHLIDIMRGDEELGLYEEPKQEKPVQVKGGDNVIFPSSTTITFKPKQETLEEFIENGGYPTGSTQEIWEQGVREGAKWQQERMYSEEEVIAIVEKSRETGLTAEYLLLTEQFKKK
jgi:hypothetical protein